MARRVRMSIFVGCITVAACCGVLLRALLSPAKVRPSRPTMITSRIHTFDCGANCLYLVLRHAGRTADLEELRSASHTTRSGTSMLHLKEVAHREGFNVSAASGTFADLYSHLGKRGHYGILHLYGSHFVTAIGRASNRKVRIIDPSFGVRDVDGAMLRDRYEWDGVMLLLTASV